MKVRSVMHKGLTSAPPSSSVERLARQMRREDVGAIAIKENGRLVGIVTDRDIACRAAAKGDRLDRMTARDVMTKKVVCCAADDDIKDAIRTMETRKIRRLPVLDRQKNLVGMLSLGDISHKVKRALAGELLHAVSAHHR